FAVATPERLGEALAAGELDLLTAEALGQPTAAPAGVRLASVASTAAEGIDLNLDHPTLRDRPVREALLRALDRPALAAAAGLAPASAAAARTPTTIPLGATASDAAAARYPHDPARAAELLQAAGWSAGPDGARTRDGKRLELRLLTSDDGPRQRLAEAIRGGLARVGVALVVEAV